MFNRKAGTAVKQSGSTSWGSKQNVWDKIRNEHVKVGRKHHLSPYLPHCTTGPSSHSSEEKQARFYQRQSFQKYNP